MEDERSAASKMERERLEKIAMELLDEFPPGENNLRVTNRAAVSAVSVQSRREKERTGNVPRMIADEREAGDRWKGKEYCGRRCARR